jgi:hypothetical protein
VTGSACYLVAVTRGLGPDALDGADALRGSPLRLVERGGLQGVVCDVDLDEFGEASLPRNLEDLAWVEEMARAHHSAVSAVARLGTTVPMRFATIYDSDERVAEQLTELHDQLAAALDRIEGRAEWSVKVYAAAEASPPSDRASPESGASYLMRKRDAASERRAREERDAEVLAEVHRALSALAVASRTLMPQDPRLTERREPMRMNAAYLVADDTTETFLAHARSALSEHPGLRLEVGGPWPPYSFASLEPA